MKQEKYRRIKCGICNKSFLSKKYINKEQARKELKKKIRAYMLNLDPIDVTTAEIIEIIDKVLK